MCGSQGLEVGFSWDRPPDGETRFAFFDEGVYHREFLRCPRCGHWQARMSLDLGLHLLT